MIRQLEQLPVTVASLQVSYLKGPSAKCHHFVNNIGCVCNVKNGKQEYSGKLAAIGDGQ